MSWEVVIGLETHAQLSTASKIFSGAPTAYGAEPNTQSCAVDLALPGALPVLNKTAVEKAITFGLAIGAEVAPMSVFARKNYFYPDLPKGYQISQFELPVVIGGTLLSGGVGTVFGSLFGVLIQGLIQTYINFDGTLSSWWTKIAIGILLFIFIALQRGLTVLWENRQNAAVTRVSWFIAALVAA